MESFYFSLSAWKHKGHIQLSQKLFVFKCSDIQMFKVSKYVLGSLFTWANITISHMISSYNSEEQKLCKS